MPVALSYPGVYVEEIPSGVHTLTGVSTSVTAFIGFTAKGEVNEPAHIFSFADFDRQFGGLSIDSPVSFAVRDFFQNGGTEAWIVRAANGAVPASTKMRDKSDDVLEVTALSQGTAGNFLQIDVAYDTKNPDSLFSLYVEQYGIQNGKQVLQVREIFPNLTLNSQNPYFAELVVNNQSNLIRVQRLKLNTGDATSTSGAPTLAELQDPALQTSYRLGYMLNGTGPFEAVVAAPTLVAAGATIKDRLDAIRQDIEKAINDQQTLGVSSALAGGDTKLQFKVKIDPAHPAENASIQFQPASMDDVTRLLHLGIDQGGVEIDGAAAGRPKQTGTADVPLNPPFPAGATADLEFDLKSAVTGGVVTSGPLTIWGPGTQFVQPADIDELIAQINAAFASVATTQPALAGAFAQRNGGMVRIVPGPADPNLSFEFKGPLATALGLDGAANPGRNLARYALGVGVTAFYQTAGNKGNDGTPPGSGDLIGSALKKTGMYALETVDLFNLLVIPEASVGNGLISVLMEALAYCQRRRAFMIIDAPENVNTFTKAQAWTGSGDFLALRNRNCAIYFPRLRYPHPLKQNIVQPFPAAGALAGIYAATDATRGVWKAPAGIQAILTGVTGLTCTLTDGENGVLNLVGLNGLRSFPVIGNVAWGARTGRGADILADEYKYVPIRRLALYLEESLYRGTQWAVFEPNDEPLWSQIRLNLGAFMHTLFAQGAFQGSTPREAYFVKCDKETTTQNDIDRGVVNIVVGFAPLKPAEFVVIKIQQIAGALQV
jgi:phage tail sheath protein FI